MKFIIVEELDSFTSINVDHIVLFYQEGPESKTIIKLTNGDEVHVEESDLEVRRLIGVDYFE
jgi:hypothetical protein